MAEIKQSGSGQMFKNPFLERLTRTHISIPLTLFYGAAIAAIIYTTIYTGITPAEIIGMFFAGFFLWTLLEYLIHKYLFHIAEFNPKLERLQYTLHGIHHEYPRDKMRLAMPPLVSIVLAIGFFALFYAIFGLYGFSFGAGFVAAYASYLLVHYSVHAFVPPDNFLRKLWVHHSIHHYKDPKSAFGVSSPLWDYIFGTMPAKY
jgi:sterol desaturase/sphingolipid hydroxylase (fatty acid hydroxylase superfamily)